MNRHHQDSLLDAVRQGEEGHETAAKSRYLVCADSVFNTAGIHIPDPKIACEIRLKDGEREVAAILAYESAK
jgi:hypothetical protein